MRAPEPIATHYGLKIAGVYYTIPTADTLACVCDCSVGAKTPSGRVLCRDCGCPFRPMVARPRVTG